MTIARDNLDMTIAARALVLAAGERRHYAELASDLHAEVLRLRRDRARLGDAVDARNQLLQVAALVLPRAAELLALEHEDLAADLAELSMEIARLPKVSEET